MDRLTQRLGTAQRALETLRPLLKRRKSKVVRDAAIQRFEYTFEAVWKAAQLYLKQQEGLDLASPKSVIRGFGQIGMLGKEHVQLAIAMADDRNLTVHAYNESLAEAIYSRLSAYAQLMEDWLHSMGERRKA